MHTIHTDGNENALLLVAQLSLLLRSLHRHMRDCHSTGDRTTRKSVHTDQVPIHVTSVASGLVVAPHFLFSSSLLLISSPHFSSPPHSLLLLFWLFFLWGHVMIGISYFLSVFFQQQQTASCMYIHARKRSTHTHVYTDTNVHTNIYVHSYLPNTHEHVHKTFSLTRTLSYALSVVGYLLVIVSVVAGEIFNASGMY